MSMSNSLRPFSWNFATDLVLKTGKCEIEDFKSRNQKTIFKKIVDLAEWKRGKNGDTLQVSTGDDSGFLSSTTVSHPVWLKLLLLILMAVVMAVEDNVSFFGYLSFTKFPFFLWFSLQKLLLPVPHSPANTLLHSTSLHFCVLSGTTPTTILLTTNYELRRLFMTKVLLLL